MAANDFSDVLDNTFRAGLRSRKKQIGLWSMSCNHMVAEILSYSGFDWLLFDTEHSPNDLSELVCQLQAMRGSPTSSVVRPAWNDTVLIKRLLDIGFHNFVVPFVESADQARAAVAATRYPPDGIRGVSVMSRSSFYGNVPEYWQKINQQVSVIIQIESQAGLDNLDEICQVEELDGVFLGPNDMAASIGHLGDTGHKDVQDVIKHVADTCQKYGKAAGILTGVEEEIRRYLAWGYTFVAVGADLALLKNAAKASAEKYK